MPFPVWTRKARRAKLPALRKTKSQSKSTPTTAAGGAVTGMRLLCFRLLASVGIPLTFLLLAETALRLAGYGYSTHFFQKRWIRGQAFWTDNQDYGRRFFPPGLVRNPHPFTLPVAKPPETLRLFVFGESAAMGDPDFKFGLPRMLEVLMRERFPNKRIEVINAAMVAISSHVVLPIARECARHEGDLWIVYMGNNEIIGPFGSVSIFGTRAPPLPFIRAGLWVKTTRFGQLLDEAVDFARQEGTNPCPSGRAWP